MRSLLARFTFCRDLWRRPPEAHQEMPPPHFSFSSRLNFLSAEGDQVKHFLTACQSTLLAGVPEEVSVPSIWESSRNTNVSDVLGDFFYLFFCSLKQFVSFSSETSLRGLAGSAFLQLSHYYYLRSDLGKHFLPSLQALLSTLIFSQLEQLRVEH